MVAAAAVIGQSVRVPTTATCSRKPNGLRNMVINDRHLGNAVAGKLHSQARRRCARLAVCAEPQVRSASAGPSSSKAAELIQDGKALFAANDRMGALGQFEEATRVAVTASEFQAAYFNAACVHASFGDVEPAQSCLRSAINSGLVLEQALKDPTLLRISASPQVVIQLKKFAANVARQQQEQVSGAAAARAATSMPRAAPKPGPSVPGGWRAAVDQDLTELLQTENQGIDASFGAIVRRVAIVLVVGVALGVGLFFFGLQYAFPERP